MDLSLWPAAAFAFVFVLLGVLRLARTSDEVVWGACAALAVSALVLFVSPAALIPVGVLVVIMAWWRTDSALTKNRSKSPLGHVWAPERRTDAGGADVVARFLEGWAQGTQQAKQRGLVPWSGTSATPAQEADGLVDRAQRRNPFRPEGAIGLRVGVPLDSQRLSLHGGSDLDDHDRQDSDAPTAGTAP